MKYIKTIKKLYDVDKIIARKIKRGKKYYLIKWKGYSLDYCSWEPLSHLTNILHAVKFFDDNYPLSIEKEEYKQFMKLYRNYQKQKRLNKKQDYEIKERNENRNPKSNLIIIDLDEFIVTETKKEENSTNYELSTITESETQIEVEINIEEEKEDNEEESKKIKNGLNINGETKLIKPILIW